MEKISTPKKIAFVCSGGAAKACAFHLGVTLAMQERGFKFLGGRLEEGESRRESLPWEVGTYVGSSAGSLLMAMIAAGFSLENIYCTFTEMDRKTPDESFPYALAPIRYSRLFRLTGQNRLRRIRTMKMLGGVVKRFAARDFSSLMKMDWFEIGGIFSASGMEEYVRKDLLKSNDFSDYRSELFIVATELDRARKVIFGPEFKNPGRTEKNCLYRSDTGISQAVAASSALPLIFEPWRVDHEDGHSAYYIDGEFRETLSSHVGVDTGADLVFASHTHQPLHRARLGDSLARDGLPAILIQSIYIMIEQKIRAYKMLEESSQRTLTAAEKFCQEHKLPRALRNELLSTLEESLQVRRGERTILIHPDPQDESLFFADHFTLSPKKLRQMIVGGYQSAQKILAEYHFEGLDDPKRKTADRLSLSLHRTVG